MANEKLIAEVVLLSDQLTKEANSRRGETKKTTKAYNKALKALCEVVGANPEEVERLINPYEGEVEK